MIEDDRLRDYADRLEQAGFVIYEPTGPNYTGDSYFRYSRVVDGKECFGGVGHDGYRTDMFRTYQHRMPIKPSREHGSSMFVDGVEDGGVDHLDVVLTVEAAERVASPRNHNRLVGWHANYDDPRWSHMYTRRGGEEVTQP